MCNSWVFNVGIRTKKHKKPLTDTKLLNLPFSFPLMEPSLNSQTFLKLKDFKINGKTGTPGQKVTFASLLY